ncbi:MAG: hypothetical protein R3B06_10960 [Kofleriaceae bacterium]
MSARLALALGLVAAAAGTARAQADEADRFYADKADDDRDGSLWQGALTSSSLAFAEAAAAADPLVAGGASAEVASSVAKLWTELRLQLDGRHLKGGRWDVRVDTRLRYVASAFDNLKGDANRIQAGLFGTNEYELRELYAVRGGRRTDVFVGRQVVADLGAIRVDGIRVDYAKNARWTYLGFAGAYPARGSRSVATDYPRGVTIAPDPVMPGGIAETATGRVIPITGGFGAAYRTQNSYGAIGAVTIVPTSRDEGAGGNGTYELARLYLAANGYWRKSAKLDLWHYVVLDLYGTAGVSPTNASVGLQYKPTSRLRLQLAGNQIDTEALNVQVRALLENDAPQGGPIINNYQVQRIGNTMVRGAVSALLGRQRRFELTAALHGRRRPDVVLVGGAGPQVLPAAQSLEVHGQLVDRHFYGGLRAEASVMRSVSLGQASYARSVAQVIRVGGTRELKGGRAQVTGDLSWVSSADDNAGKTCSPGMVATCYGSANTNAFQLSALGYYRWKADWFVTGSAGLGLQQITVTDPIGGGGVAQPAIKSVQLFARVGYRF